MSPLSIVFKTLRIYVIFFFSSSDPSFLVLYHCKLMHNPDPDGCHWRANINSEDSMEFDFNLKIEMETLLGIKILFSLSFLGTLPES